MAPRTSAKEKQEEAVMIPSDQIHVVDDQIHIVEAFRSGVGQDGDHFMPDGYIRNAGEIRGKWFQKIDGIRIWGPNLDRVAWIESLYQRVKADQERRWAKTMVACHAIFAQGGLAHAEASDEHESVRLYKAEMFRFSDGEERLSFTSDRVKRPEKLLLPDLGSELHSLYHGANRRLLVKGILLEALARKLPPLSSAGPRTLERLRVNGREYYFVIEATRWGGKEWRLIAEGTEIPPLLDLGSYSP